MYRLVGIHATFEKMMKYSGGNITICSVTATKF